MKIDIVTKEEFNQVLVLLEEINHKLEKISEKSNSLKGSWLKGKQVQELLNCSPATVQNYRVRGVLNFKKIGGTFYYSAQSLNQLTK